MPDKKKKQKGIKATYVKPPTDATEEELLEWAHDLLKGLRETGFIPSEEERLGEVEEEE